MKLVRVCVKIDCRAYQNLRKDSKWHPLSQNEAKIRGLSPRFRVAKSCHGAIVSAKPEALWSAQMHVIIKESQVVIKKSNICMRLYIFFFFLFFLKIKSSWLCPKLQMKVSRIQFFNKKKKNVAAH